MQFKTTHQLNKKTTLTFLGVGAIDEFSFAAPKKATPEKLYTLNSNPSIEQNNYTIGASIRKIIPNGYWNLAISRNYFNNQLEKYENNLGPIKGVQTLFSKSTEAENKLRFDVTKNIKDWKITYGTSVQLVNFTSNTFQIIQPAVTDNNGNIVTNAVTANFNSAINFVKAGAFIQVGKRLLNNRLAISAGLRTDGNSFTNNGWNF
jgi:hypothetical protein